MDMFRMEMDYGDDSERILELKIELEAKLGKSRYPYWRCKDSVVLRLEDMTDSHLDNAIKYVTRVNGNKSSLKALQKEQSRRQNGTISL